MHLGDDGPQNNPDSGRYVYRLKHTTHTIGPKGLENFNKIFQKLYLYAFLKYLLIFLALNLYISSVHLCILELFGSNLEFIIMWTLPINKMFKGKLA